MRDLENVLEQLLEVVEDYDLRATLRDNRSSVRCAAPEIMPFWWNEVGHALSVYLNEDLDDMLPWEKDAWTIWVGRDIREVLQ